MKTRLAFSISIFTLIVQFGCGSSYAQTAEEILQQKNISNQEPTRILSPAERQTTMMMIDQNEKSNGAGIKKMDQLQNELTMGKERANAMIKIIQDDEMKKALEKVTVKGNDILKNNPEIHTPIGVIAGAVSLWAGRTFQLIKTESIKVTSFVAGKERGGNFNIESPLFSGRLRFDQANGMNLGVNRTISSFNTSASFEYNMKSQGMSTSVNQQIAPHLNFSIGAGQSTLSAPEGTARIQYELNF